MEFEEKLKPIIEKAIEAAEATGEFVIEQAPLLLQEFYTWHTVGHLLGMVLSLCVAIIPTLICKRLASTEEEDRWAANFWGKMIDKDLSIGLYILSSATLVLGVVMFLIDLFGFIKILIAPRLYIIEYFLS